MDRQAPNMMVDAIPSPGANKREGIYGPGRTYLTMC
jgi:hypothetical protein